MLCFQLGGGGGGEAVMSQLGSSYCSFTMLMLKLHFTVFSTVFSTVFYFIFQCIGGFENTIKEVPKHCCLGVNKSCRFPSGKLGHFFIC